MRLNWLGALAVFAGLGLFIASGMAQGEKQGEGAQGFKQVKLTEEKMQSFISAQKQLAPVASKLEASGNKPDPAVQKEIEQIATSNGFSTVGELADVTANVSLVLAGLDPKTGQFTEPPDLIRKEIEDVKKDEQLTKEDKDQVVAEMQEALKAAAPIQFKENVALVKKYQKEIDQIRQQPENQQEPTK